MGETRSPTHVAFYNSAYIVLFDDGSWKSQGLCKKLERKMKQSQSNIEFVSLGPNQQWFFRRGDEKVFYDVDDEKLRADLHDPADLPYKLWFNNEDGYILQYDDLRLSWNDIPQSFHNKLNGRQKSLPKVKNITFGTNDTWWVSFQDDRAGWSPNILSDIKENLLQTNFLALDPVNEDNYFLIEDDGHLHWRANNVFDDDINDDDDDDINEDDKIVYIDPQDIRYTQASISNRLSNGQFIEELREDLEDDVLSVHDIPTINVVNTRSGNYWSLNNRRLWCFRHANNIDKIPVRIVSKRPSWFDERIRHLQNSFNIDIRGHSEASDSESDSNDSNYSDDDD